MPKSTFNNLPPEKQAHVRAVLLDIFYQKPVSQVKVSEIVAALQMSRGIFYKYFEDLTEAYEYLIHYYAGQIHGEIIASIMSYTGDYFKGIEKFLLLYIDLPANDPRQKQLILLTQNSYLFSERALEDFHGLHKWQEILANNHFMIDTEAEQISFLYFSMKLVIDSLTDMLANDWGKSELLQDFHFKTTWLLQGIKKV